jgi:Flp pilus assembly protein TadG
MKNGTASRNFWHDSGGAAGLLFGLSLPVLAAATGAAIDYNGWIKQRSELQVMADRAALAGAKALLERYFDEKTARESAALAAAESTIGQTRPGALSNIAIVDGGSAVKVDIQEPPVIYFAKLLGFAPASLGTTAIAVVADSLPVCVIALAPTAPNALSIMGNAGLDASPCVVWVNSSAAQALRVGSNATLRAMRNCVVGGVSASGNVLATPRKCDVYPDPLAKWIQPQAQHCDYVNFSVSSSVPVTLSAGTYCGGINVTASDVTFGPGTYIVRDGPLKVSGSGNISGTDVGIHMTGANASIAMSSNARLRLRAPTSGHMAGLVFSGDRQGGIADAKIAGAISLDLEGTVYLPQHNVSLSGTSDTALGAEFSQFIGYTFSFTGNSTVAVRTNYDKTAVPRIKLDSGIIYLRT